MSKRIKSVVWSYFVFFYKSAEGNLIGESPCLQNMQREDRYERKSYLVLSLPPTTHYFIVGEKSFFFWSGVTSAEKNGTIAY